MKKIYKGIDQLIGRTPLMELVRIEEHFGLEAKILAKLEYFNPAGSVKDRVALSIIQEAEKEGKLKKGSVIIEPTSGNTGVGLAAVGASRGYQVIIVMPDTMSVERRLLMQAYGARLVLTDGKLGMAGAIKKAEELAESIEGSVIGGQFVNPANPQAHRLTTGPEIFEDCGGEVDIFVCGVGTGGTITGVGEYLKGKDPNIKVVAVEPASSPLLSGGNAAPHKLQGIGANFIPDVLSRTVYDSIFPVSDGDAYSMGRLVGKTEGLLVGISSGASLFAAVQLGMLEENKGKNIVVLLPDTGERYLSTPGYYGE